MPLPSDTIRTVTTYYRKDMGVYTEHLEKFDFIDNKNLQERLAQEFYIARYIAKFQEAMNFDENSFEMLGNLKFQIVQYAGILEAVISYLLMDKFVDDPKVINLQIKREYKTVPG